MGEVTLPSVLCTAFMIHQAEEAVFQNAGYRFGLKSRTLFWTKDGIMLTYRYNKRLFFIIHYR